jgi:hypothetical protein
MSRNACTELIVHMLFTREKKCQGFLKYFWKIIFASALARERDDHEIAIARSRDGDSERRGPH